MHTCGAAVVSVALALNSAKQQAQAEAAEKVAELQAKAQIEVAKIMAAWF